MLGKQWLNRYDAVDMRGSAIERSQNRQTKLNGIVAWYFDHVVESLPLMLQAALLLLGCGLSLFLWDINITIASVVLGGTSFGVVFYLFIVAAGTGSASCPYQTPGSRILRSAVSAILAIGSACRRVIEHSHTAVTLGVNMEHYRPWWSRNRVVPFLKDVLCEVPHALAIDAFQLGRMIVRVFATFVRGGYTRFLDAISTAEQGSDERTTVLDLHCISWILQTSLDKEVHLLTLEYLATLVTLADFNPTLVVDCFNTLIGCVKVLKGEIVVTQGLERLATVSSAGFLRTYAHLSTVNPTSGVLTDIHRRYIKVFQPDTGFKNLPFSHTFGAIHTLFHRYQRYWWVRQVDPRPSDREHVTVIHALTELAKSKYRRRRDGRKKVPRWILSSVMHSLSQSPPLPTSAVVDCLSIIATDLGCDVPSVGTPNLDERCVHTRRR